MILRKIFILFWLSGITAGIGYLFWNQEIKYTRPTPVPESYSPPSLNTKIELPEDYSIDGKPLFFHFFNPECPCSRFNIKHFNSLVKQYQKQVEFIVVIPADKDIEEASELVAEGLRIVKDTESKLAVTCGVYSTPQATIIDKDGNLYYRGNYNKARYCTKKSSNYAQVALSDLLKGKPLQEFGTFSSVAYGCEFYEAASIL